MWVSLSLGVPVPLPVPPSLSLPFPSAGISNPTFTIITLSIRLADHLAARFGKAAAASHQPGTTAKASLATA